MTGLPTTGHRGAILDAASAILADEGVPGLNVSALMRRAGISRTAFYREFEDIYAVVAAVLGPIAEELAQAAGDWYRGQIGTPDVIHGNLLSFARTVQRHGPTLEAIWVGTGLDTGIRARWDEFVDGFAQQTEAAITRDQHAGAIDPHLDARAAALALTWMGEQASLRLMGRRHAGTPQDYADLLAPVWTRTLFGVPDTTE